MKKIFRSITVIVIIVSVLITSSVGVYAAGSDGWISVGDGWKFRVDGPHTGTSTGKWHVHVKGPKGKTGSQGVDGSESHGDTMKKVPKSVKKKIENHKEYKKAQKNQKKLNKSKAKIKSKIKKKKLKLDWKHVGDVTVAVGIVVAATGTFFFPGDDVASWLNLFRVLGLT